MLLAGLVAGAAASAAPSAPSPTPQAESCSIPFDPAASLRARVGPPSALVLETYAGSGARDVASHRLTDAEWAKVDAAIAALPRLHRDVLQRHLRRISFVDTASGGGNALTSAAESECGDRLFDLTFRAGLFEESLTAFLNDKEAGLFEPDASGMRVHIEAGGMDVLPYILLHESTHIVDGVLGISGDDRSAFRQDIWTPGERRMLLPPYDANPVAGIAWRGGAKAPLGRAAELYRGLSRTPFVSLYASAAAPEDLAETVAWQQLATRFDVELLIEVKRADGGTVFRYAPLESPHVRARFTAVEALLARASY